MSLTGVMAGLNTASGVMNTVGNVASGPARMIGGTMAAINTFREARRAKKEAKKWYDKAGDRPIYDAPEEYAENAKFSANMFNANMGEAAAAKGREAEAASARREARRVGTSFSDMVTSSENVTNNLMKAGLDADIAFSQQKNQLAESLKAAKKDLASSKEDEFEYNQAGRYAEYMNRGDAFENRRFEMSNQLSQQFIGMGSAVGGAPNASGFQGTMRM